MGIDQRHIRSEAEELELDYLAPEVVVDGPT